MSSIAFDTLKYVETLTSAGFSESQAKAMAHAQQAVLVNLSERQLATKLDLINLGNKVEMDIANLSNKIDVEIASLSNKTDKDIANLNNKIDRIEAEFKGKFNLLYWMNGFMLTFLVAIAFKLFL